MEDFDPIENIDLSDFPPYQPPFPQPVDPGFPIDPRFPSAPSESPDFEAMKVKRGDVITADMMNGLIDALQTLYNRVQANGGTTVNRSGRVMEVEGIGRARAKALAREGIVTLYDLGTESADKIAGYIDNVDSKEATQMVSDAYQLAGGVSGHPLTDLESIGVQKARRLERAGIKNIKELSAADPKKIGRALGVDQKTAKSLKKTAKELIPKHSTS